MCTAIVVNILYCKNLFILSFISMSANLAEFYSVILRRHFLSVMEVTGVSISRSSVRLSRRWKTVGTTVLSLVRIVYICLHF